jgi:hypothetical protein
MEKSNRSSIFISYHHRDESWKDRLVTHLGILQHEGLLDLWDDRRRIRAGEDWIKEIDRAIKNAGIIIMLISADYLTSDYILNIEIPNLLKQQQESGSIILPVILRPCLWHHIKWLMQIQVFPTDGKPLSSRTETEIEEDFAELSETVFSLLEIAEKTKVSYKDSEDQLEKDIKIVDIFISHDSSDGDFAELLKEKIEKVGITAWIDTERLKAGEDWRQEIDQAIKNAKSLIIVMSPEARKSEYVTYEWSFAYGVGIKIIPIMIKQTQLHPRLESFQYLDFTNRRARPWNELIDSLKKI